MKNRKKQAAKPPSPAGAHDRLLDTLRDMLTDMMAHPPGEALAAQIHALDEAFYHTLAAACAGDCEIHLMDLALQMQRQSRLTAETLAALRHRYEKNSASEQKESK